MSNTDWEYKQEWWHHGKDFLVTVKKHLIEPYRDEGANRWAVYAFIYPKHPFFNGFSGNDMFQPSACALPLHCGVSLFKWHWDNDGKATAVQIGADYHHLYDERFSHMETKEDAYEVFKDAKELIEHLTETKPMKEQPAKE